MKNKIILCGFCVLWIILSLIVIKLIFFRDISIIPSISQNNSWESDGNLHVLTSIDDVVVEDSMWCGTFQLVWNDMVNEVVKQDVVFNPQLKIVENLNKQTFTNKELSPDSYYSKFGLLTLDLKKEIESGIKEKFNETSDILGQGADWSNVPQSDDYYEGASEKKYGFYAMLKKIFKFENIFDQLDNGKFADKYNNIKYFGIDEDSDDKLYKQVYVYYYNTDSDFAVALMTKEGEDVVLARGVGGDSFADIYNNILENEKEYNGKHYFTSLDYLKVPELEFKNLAEFKELENKEFPLAESNRVGKIDKALQAIQLKLDKEGGEIKSEVWVSMTANSASFFEPEVLERYFYFDQPYVMFLKEADKDLPYFAAQISDITLFQN